MHLPAVILLFHGSSDHQHNEQAKALAEAVGAGYAFMETEPRFAGEGLAIPMFIADGEDYRKALAAATVKSPPCLSGPASLTICGASARSCTSSTAPTPPAR